MTITVNSANVVFNDSSVQTTGYGAPSAFGRYNIYWYNTAPGSVYNPGSYTKPASLKFLKVTCLGAGGRGANTVGPAPVNASAGGGGAGGLASAIIPAANLPASPITVTIGTAPGGTSSFGTFVTASGGSAGVVNGSATPSAPAAGIGAGGSGGSGSVGAGASSLLTISGSPGNPGWYMFTSPGTGTGGEGGNAEFGLGYGGYGGFYNPPINGGNGFAAVGFGAGGGGAVCYGSPTAYTGGQGGPGMIFVEEFY